MTKESTAALCSAVADEAQDPGMLGEAPCRVREELRS